MASIFEKFYIELDQLWDIPAPNKIPLKIIGASSILLQMEYAEGTKDCDILETKSITSSIEKKLLSLGGKGSKLSTIHRVYIEFVNPSLPFLPQRPKFNSVPSLSKLKHFHVYALDLTDVIISKLIRFSPNDVKHIRVICENGKVKHDRLIDRFKDAVYSFESDARSQDLPEYIRNLNTVERDFLNAPITKIELPHWI